MTSAHETDIALIHELWVEYVSALISGDMERWMSLWISEGIEMQPAGQRHSGIEQIGAALQPVIDLFDSEMTILPESVHIIGDWAYSYGSYKHAITPKEGGESISDAGMFLTVLERQANGSWKIAITCFNIRELP